MGREINLLKKYPKSKRNIQDRKLNKKNIKRLQENLIKDFLMVVEILDMVDLIIMKDFGARSLKTLKNITI